MMGLFDNCRPVYIHLCPNCELVCSVTEEQCPNCGYDLESTEGYECSECGLTFAYGEEAEGHWEDQHEYA
jgi:hypothetical protein